MDFREMKQAIAEAKDTLRKADNLANDMAYILQGRLRNVTGYNLLKALKYELKDFNASTGQWK